MSGLILKALVAASLSLAIVSIAAAADMPTKAPPPVVSPAFNKWTGFYVGVNGGYGWGRSQQSTITNTATSGGYSQNGGLVGGTVGFNYQITNWVLGAEFDWDWANIDGTLLTPVCAGTACFTKLRSFGTVRPRLGYAWDAWMVYVTGGIAWANIKVGQDSCFPANICGTRDGSGWTIGGGVEAFVMPKLSVKAEYLYADFGDHNYYNPGTTIHAPEKINIVRAGLNYHF